MRRNYGFNIQEIRNIHLMGFPIKQLLERSLVISVGPLFSKYDWIGASHSGLHPLISFGLKYIFSSRFLSF